MESVSYDDSTSLSWLHPLGRPPSDEPFCEQEEQEDFLGTGCQRFTLWSINSGATGTMWEMWTLILSHTDITQLQITQGEWKDTSRPTYRIPDCLDIWSGKHNRLLRLHLCQRMTRRIRAGSCYAVLGKPFPGMETTLRLKQCFLSQLLNNE